MCITIPNQSLYIKLYSESKFIYNFKICPYKINFMHFVCNDMISSDIKNYDFETSFS